MGNSRSAWTAKWGGILPDFIPVTGLNSQNKNRVRLITNENAFCNKKENADVVPDGKELTCQQIVTDLFYDQGSTEMIQYWDNLSDETCSKSENIRVVTKKDKVTGDDTETCFDRDTKRELAMEWCTTGDNITEDSTWLCTKETLGEVNYKKAAEEYCYDPVNSNKEFCKCYNVVNYETVCVNKPTSVGCAKAKEVYDKYIKYEIPDPNVWLPCGNFCKGESVYKPTGYNAGCSGTIAACIQNIEVGAAHDEINAACEINTGDANELTSGSSGGSGGSDGSDGSGGSTSVPLSTTQTSDLEKTVAKMKKQKEEEDEEAKKTNKKLLIGGGGGGILSSISCLMFLVIVVVLLSKKGGGGRRR